MSKSAVGFCPQTEPASSALPCPCGPRAGLFQPRTRVRRPDGFHRHFRAARSSSKRAVPHMIERYGLRIDDFLGGRCGVSHAAGILWEIEVPESPGDGVRHVAVTIMRTYRESAAGRSRPMRDLLVGQDPGRLIGRQLAVHDLFSPDSLGPGLQGPSPSRRFPDGRLLLRSQSGV